MDMIDAVGLEILGTIVLASLVGLIIGCIYRYKYRTFTPTKRLQDDAYLNWLRGSVALLYLKESLEEFTDKRVSDFHDILHTIVPQPYSRHGPLDPLHSQQQASPCIQTCTTCSHNDIQRYRQNWRVRCSSMVCSEWMKHIVMHHIDCPNPNIVCLNLKPQLWPSHPWEVAKCFLPIGCEGVTAARDADVAAIVTLLKTCVYMSKFITDYSLLTEVLDIRNRLMHSPNLTVSDDQLQHDTDKMIQLLRSLDHLIPTESETIERTIDNITKLQSKSMDMTRNKEVIALNTRMEAVDRELASLRDKCSDYDKSRQDLTKTSQYLETLHEDYQKAKAEIDQLKAVRAKFDKFLEKNNLLEDMAKVSTRVEELDQRVDNHNTRLDKVEEQVEAIADVLPADICKTWQEQCKDLQAILINHYRSTCLLVQNPLENSDIGLEYLYVDPAVKSVGEGKGQNGSQNGKEEVNSISYRKLFYSNDTKCRQIFVTGDAGVGKSMLCKYLVRLWCAAHDDAVVSTTVECDSDEEDSSEHSSKTRGRRQQATEQLQEDRTVRNEDDDRQLLSPFMFLFYITLRDCLSEYSLCEMIRTQILQNYDILKDISASALLEDECCLVIVDGLDEMVWPEGTVQHSGVLGREISNINNVILTTTRPWKLKALELKASEVDNYVELCGIHEQSASQLCSKVIKLKNKSQSGYKSKQEFFRTLKKDGYDHFKSIPGLIIQLLCLWLDNQELGKSQVQLFSSILDSHLKKAQKNVPEITSTSKSTQTETLLPNCIVEHPYCQTSQQLIYSLSKVAFESLFSKVKEHSLLFSSSQIEMAGLGQEAVNMCLKSGILLQSKVLEINSATKKKMSFFHKKFQEFLASIYIVSSADLEDVVKCITDFCCTLDVCLEMSQVWLFIAGLSPDIARQLLTHLTDVVAADQQVMEYRQMLDGHGLIEAIQTCNTDFMIEGNNNGFTYESIYLEDFYISKTTFCHVEPLLSCTQSSKIKSMYMDTSGIDSDQLATAICQLQKCHSVQKLHLIDHWSCIPSRTVAEIVDNNCDALTCLSLHDLITATDELVTATCICNTSSKCLKALKLYNVKMMHKHKEQILNTLAQSSTMKELALLLKCTDRGRHCKGRIDLSAMKQIERLELLSMHVDNLQTVSQSVEKVYLWDVTIPVTALQEFARRISQVIHKVTAELSYVTITDVRDRSVDVETFLYGFHGLKVTECKYNASDSKWFIALHTCNQKSH